MSLAADAREAAPGRARLRLLAVQTTSLPTPETSVLRALLESVAAPWEDGHVAAGIDVLLPQGGDLRAGRTNALMESFRSSPGGAS